MKRMFKMQRAHLFSPLSIYRLGEKLRMQVVKTAKLPVHWDLIEFDGMGGTSTRVRTSILLIRT